MTGFNIVSANAACTSCTLQLYSVCTMCTRMTNHYDVHTLYSTVPWSFQVVDCEASHCACKACQYRVSLRTFFLLDTDAVTGQFRECVLQLIL